MFSSHCNQPSTGHQLGIINNCKSNLLNSKQKYVNINNRPSRLEEIELFEVNLILNDVKRC